MNCIEGQQAAHMLSTIIESLRDLKSFHDSPATSPSDLGAMQLQSISGRTTTTTGSATCLRVLSSL